MGLQVGHDAAGLSVPLAHHTVDAAAGHGLAVGADRHAPHAASVARQGDQWPAAVNRPEPYRPVETTAGDRSPIGADRHAAHHTRVAVQDRQRAPGVPHTHRPVEAAWANLVARYGGNGLALKLVGDTIRQVFAGDVAAFLEETHSCVFGGIRRLLDVQFKRLSSVERDILCWLAVQRESATFGELTAFADSRHGRGAVLESLEALRRRSLIERTDALGGFTLQPVVLDYVIAWMTEQVPARAAW
jgi:hypothetical protein